MEESRQIIPKISIVTIVFNGVEHLERTILSVLNQNYPNFEYIIIDGGSTDGTIDIIKKYENSISSWISEPDKGVSDAFNKGISMATGEVIGLLNADDWYEGNTLKLISTHYKSNSILHGNIQYWNPDGTKGLYMYPNESKIFSEMTINHPTVFVSKVLYDKHGTFSLDYKLAMDYHLLLRMKLARVNFIYINTTLANMNSGGLSGDWKKSYQEVFKAKEVLMGHRAQHRVMLIWQILRRTTSEKLQGTSLSFLNKYYRRYFSSMKKA